MKKIILILTFLLLFCLSNISNAIEIKIITKKQELELKKDVSRKDVFEFLGTFFDRKIPESYKYINLKFKDVSKNTSLYTSLQKLVYLDLIKNIEKKIYPNKTINLYNFLKLSEIVLKGNFINDYSKNDLKSKNTTFQDLNKLKTISEKEKSNFGFTSDDNLITEKKAIFSDVYKTLMKSHYDKDSIKQSKMIYGAIEGLAKGTDDKYTTYFPPTESKNFYETLNGNYEGIGSYVDMEKPGAVKILTPISGSPSQKAGLKGGDLIIKVDGKKIKKENSLAEVVSWIKGPAGTTVTLTIKRGKSIFDVEVTRAKIVIKDIEYKLINRRTFYIEIKSFGDNVGANFKSALNNLKERTRVNKLIIDLRNNGGGYLGEVVKMLSYFVEKGEPVAIVKYQGDSKTYESRGYELINFSKYKIIILQNSGTASASEILIGTLKDYYPNLVIIGEKSYGKGSVQSIKSYIDGSSLKFTVAKWFTGLTKTGIDGIGITPNIELEFDLEKYKKYNIDNQLEEAIRN